MNFNVKIMAVGGLASLVLSKKWLHYCLLAGSRSPHSSYGALVLRAVSFVHNLQGLRKPKTCVRGNEMIWKMIGGCSVHLISRTVCHKTGEQSNPDMALSVLDG